MTLLDMVSNYGMPLAKAVLRTSGVITSAVVRQAGFRPLNDAARAEAAAIMDDLTEYMLPAYGHQLQDHSPVERSVTLVARAD